MCRGKHAANQIAFVGLQNRAVEKRYSYNALSKSAIAVLFTIHHLQIMSLVELGYLFLSISFSVAGQFFLKLGSAKLNGISAPNILSRVWGIFLTPELILGLTCYGLGAIAYILLLTKVDLSMAAPAISLVYVFSVLLGYFWFKEAIPLTRSLGLGFIVSGVILVAWK